jgi:segregation and condensation protein A
MSFTESASIYHVKTPSFEGPLDLLLDLIERNKLDISQISLSKVADDYISYVRSVGNFPIGMSAHFILVASTLLLIKSKSLLPALDLSDEEKQSIDELETRLRLLKAAKDSSKHIKELFGASMIFLPEGRTITPVFSPHKKITLDNILSSAENLLKTYISESRLPKAVVQKVISLEEMVDSLLLRVKKSLKLTFGEFSKGKKEKTHVIVSFLAMLELVKQGIIQVTQDNHFGEITMESSRLDVPNYS